MVPYTDGRIYYFLHKNRSIYINIKLIIKYHTIVQNQNFLVGFKTEIRLPSQIHRQTIFWRQHHSWFSQQLQSSMNASNKKENNI